MPTQTTARDNNNASLNCRRSSMSFDNLCKLLSEKYPERFAGWVLGTQQTNVTALKTELSIEPICADYVTFLQLQGQRPEISAYTQILIRTD